MRYLLNKYKERETLKTVFFIAVGTYLLTLVFVFLYFNKKVSALERTVFAIDPESGVVFKVERQEYSLGHRVLEYKSHVRNFLYLFFQFDQNTFLDNMDRASYLMSRADFDEELDYYKNNKILERIQGDDVILRIVVNSISIDRKGDGYIGTFDITQYYRSISKSAERARSIKGMFAIGDSEGRTPENPHAATIFDYTITERKNLD